MLQIDCTGTFNNLKLLQSQGLFDGVMKVIELALVAQCSVETAP